MNESEPLREAGFTPGERVREPAQDSSSSLLIRGSQVRALPGVLAIGRVTQMGPTVLFNLI